MNITVESPYKLIPLYSTVSQVIILTRVVCKHIMKIMIQGHFLLLRYAVMRDLSFTCTMMHVLMTFIKN